MPRDHDKNNDSRGRRDRPSGGKGRSGAARGPEKKFAKRGFAAKIDGEKRSYAAKPDGVRSYDKKPYASAGKPYAGKRDGDKPRRDTSAAPRRDAGDAPRRSRDDAPRPPRFNRDDRPARSDGDRPNRGPRKDFRPRDGGGEKRAYTPRPPREGGGEKRPYTPRAPRDGERSERPAWKRDDRAPRGDRLDRSDARPAGRSADNKFSDKKFGEKRPYTPRGAHRDDRDATARGPRNEFVNRERDRGGDRGDAKPWQKRDASSPDHVGRNSRPPREGAKRFDKPYSDKPRFDKPREGRGGEDRPRSSRAREDRPDRVASGERGPRNFDRPKFDRPREGREDRPGGDRPQGDRPFRERPKFDRPRNDRPRNSWQEHPRNEDRDDRPRRDNEDDSKVFAKRPAFGGRGAYRERKPDDDRRALRAEPKPKKAGERIAKLIARAGLASRRDAEAWVTEGRVTVNGRVINSPALDITSRDVVMVDGKPLPERERTRLFMYHKPRGLMTTHADPEGRPTVFDNLPEGLPRLISVGRLDFNTEGLLLLTNDGGLARVLELPDTGWLRRYRVRAHGEVTQAQLDQLRDGVEVDGVKYGSIDATLERDQGANVWLVFAIREGKNREVRNVMAHLGLEVNRLIRVSYGPFQLGEIAEGQVDEVKTRVLREQLGEKVAALAGAEFAKQVRDDEEAEAGPKLGRDGTPLRPKARKANAKNGLIADRKGRRVLVQRSGSEEARARNEAEANGYGPPRRPQRGYHGKRDLNPRDE